MANLYIDFGGTNFRYQINNDKIKTLQSKDIDLKLFLDGIIAQNNITNNIKSISISFAGHVSDGKILSSPNIDIKAFDLKKYLQQKHGVKLKLDNDLNCAALAEYNDIKQKPKNMAVFYIGTGFGSAFFSDGKLVKGSNNLAGEMGHIPFKSSPFVCGCGKNDCLELYGSGSGIKKWCQHYNIDEKFSKLEKLQTLHNIDAKNIVDNFFKALYSAFHTALALFDFEHLVLGGAIGSKSFVKEYLQNQLKNTSFGKKNITISTSNLKEGSLQGAKLL